ncbi:hypothetical protein F5144DRAFT_578392, partial [Chaetomium tenue]
MVDWHVSRLTAWRVDSLAAAVSLILFIPPIIGRDDCNNLDFTGGVCGGFCIPCCMVVGMEMPRLVLGASSCNRNPAYFSFFTTKSIGLVGRVGWNTTPGPDLVGELGTQI